MKDAIRIEQLELRAYIGVPDDERAQPQRLSVTLRLEPKRDFRALNDDIANAVDYACVCNFVKQLAAEKPLRLLETLAGEIAARLLAEFPLAAVELELRKFILPETKFVAVQIRREA